MVCGRGGSGDFPAALVRTVREGDGMSRGPVSALLKFLGRDPGHAGAHHWRAQRLSAFALIPLAVWFVMALVWLPDYRFDTVHAWAATPWRAVLLAVLVFCLTWHSQLGVQVVIEDYVH